MSDNKRGAHDEQRASERMERGAADSQVAAAYFEVDLDGFASDRYPRPPESRTGPAGLEALRPARRRRSGPASGSVDDTNGIQPTTGSDRGLETMT